VSDCLQFSRWTRQTTQAAHAEACSAGAADDTSQALIFNSLSAQ